MQQASDEVRKNVYKTFGRTEAMVEDDVKAIKIWMGTQKHLPEMMEDVKIRNFLNLSKFSIEKTKKKIDMYYTIRSVVPEMFEKSNPKLPHFQRLFETTYIVLFPTLVNGVHRVHLLKQKRQNTLRPLDKAMGYISTLEIRLYEDFMVDDIIIVDFENHTLNDVVSISPIVASKVVTIYKKVYSLRVKKFLFLNCPSFINILVPVLKSVLSQKMYNRIEFHTDTAVLKEIFSQSELPKDYGGDGPSLDELNEITRDKFAQYQERFDKLDSMRVDETLRMGKLDNDEILGFYGNFKKLDVD